MEFIQNLVLDLLKSVYEEIMFHELNKIGLGVERQKGIPVVWNDIKMEIGFQGRFNCRR